MEGILIAACPPALQILVILFVSVLYTILLVLSAYYTISVCRALSRMLAAPRFRQMWFSVTTISTRFAHASMNCMRRVLLKSKSCRCSLQAVILILRRLFLRRK